jgi:hypothetical protein
VLAGDAVLQFPDLTLGFAINNTATRQMVAVLLVAECVDNTATRRMVAVLRR